jgi:hypothetical protein
VTALKLSGAGAIMGVAMLLLPAVNFSGGIFDEILHVVFPTLVGGLVYVVGLKVLRVQELGQIWSVVQARTRRTGK